MAIDLKYQTADGVGNTILQYETTDATVYTVTGILTPDEKEAGMLEIKYNGVNINTGAAVDRVKIVRFKKISGTTTLVNPQTIYNSPDTGMSTADIVAVVSAGAIAFTVAGVGSATIRHSIHVQKVSSKLLS